MINGFYYYYYDKSIIKFIELIVMVHYYLSMLMYIICGRIYLCDMGLHQETFIKTFFNCQILLHYIQ
jgi:hypothetical protein